MPEESPLPWLDESWDRALAVVAHPDDMEYGAAAAVARWTAQGKDIRYLLVTQGEAGIQSMPPEQVGPLRVAEQQASCAAVGVSVVEFLDHPDGMVQPGLELRRDLAAAVRRHRPQAILATNFRDSWGGPSWNHVDHRVVGEALLDAVRDAANPWVFTDLADPVWGGVQFVAFNASPQSTHAVDVSDSIDIGVESLRCHGTYIDALGGDPEAPIRDLVAAATACGERQGCAAAAFFEILTP